MHTGRFWKDSFGVWRLCYSHHSMRIVHCERCGFKFRHSEMFYAHCSLRRPKNHGDSEDCISWFPLFLGRQTTKLRNGEKMCALCFAIWLRGAIRAIWTHMNTQTNRTSEGDSLSLLINALYRTIAAWWLQPQIVDIKSWTMTNRRFI